MELDKRREVGVIIRDARIVKSLAEMFEADWAEAETPKGKIKTARGKSKDSETDRVNEVLMKELHPVAVTLKRAVKRVVAKAGDEAIQDENVKRTVKKIVKKAVKQAVKDVTQGRACA
jgi:hypothetical protein